MHQQQGQPAQAQPQRGQRDAAENGQVPDAVGDEREPSQAKGACRDVARPEKRRRRDWREPPAEKQNRRQARDCNHAGVLRHKKHRKFEAGIFSVKPGDQLGFGFGQVKRSAIRLRHRCGEEAEEANRLRQRTRNEIPSRKKSPMESVLGGDDFGQVEAARHP